MSSPKSHRLLTLELDGVYGEDAPGTGKTRTLDRRAADTSHTDDCHVLARLNSSSMNCRALTGADPTGHQTGAVQGEVLIDLDEGPLVADRVAGKGSNHTEQPQIDPAGVVP